MARPPGARHRLGRRRAESLQSADDPSGAGRWAARTGLTRRRAWSTSR